MRYWQEGHVAFPDQRNETIAMYHADDALLADVWVRATHLGPGLPPTGRHWELRIMSVFLFEEDRLVCERVYFDVGTIMRQLGVAHNPGSLVGRVATVANHPLTIGRGLVRSLLRR